MMLHDRLTTPDDPPTDVQSRRRARGRSGAGTGRLPRRRTWAAILLERLRRVAARLRHNSRRKAALAALAARRPPACVLVLCSGNIFRSPFAAAVLRRELKRRGAGAVRARPRRVMGSISRGTAPSSWSRTWRAPRTSSS